MTDNPYLIEGPAVIGVSGGRTSGFMFRKILDAHGGRLPVDVVAIFTNTGKEREETLTFVETINREWHEIRWLEYGPSGEPTEVDYLSASREGEPFDRIIDKRGYAPGPVSRFCSSELKVLTVDRWVRKHLHFPTDWTNVVGIRSDEPRRVASMRGGSHKRGWDIQLPLADADVSEPDVMKFWKAQAFDLRLASHQGNCDLCFLKAHWKVKNGVRDEPERAVWWANVEARTGTRFRRDRPGYQEMLDQPDLFLDGEQGPDAETCYCTD